MPDTPLWSPPPDRAAQATVTRFMAEVSRRHGVPLGRKGETLVEHHRNVGAEPRLDIDGALGGQQMP